MARNVVEVNNGGPYARAMEESVYNQRRAEIRSAAQNALTPLLGERLINTLVAIDPDSLFTAVDGHGLIQQEAPYGTEIFDGSGQNYYEMKTGQRLARAVFSHLKSCLEMRVKEIEQIPAMELDDTARASLSYMKATMRTMEEVDITIYNPTYRSSTIGDLLERMRDITVSDISPESLPVTAILGLEQSPDPVQERDPNREQHILRIQTLLEQSLPENLHRSLVNEDVARRIYEFLERDCFNNIEEVTLNMILYYIQNELQIPNRVDVINQIKSCQRNLTSALHETNAIRTLGELVPPLAAEENVQESEQIGVLPDWLQTPEQTPLEHFQQQLSIINGEVNTLFGLLSQSNAGVNSLKDGLADTEQRVITGEQKLDELKARVTAVINGLTTLKERLDAFQPTIDEMQSTLQGQYDEIRHLQQSLIDQTEVISALTRRLQELDPPPLSSEEIAADGPRAAALGLINEMEQSRPADANANLTAEGHGLVPGQLAMIRRLLQNSGISVRTVGDGPNATHYIEGNVPPGLTIREVRPGNPLRGPELARIVRLENTNPEQGSAGILTRLELSGLIYSHTSTPDNSVTEEIVATVDLGRVEIHTETRAGSVSGHIEMPLYVLREGRFPVLPDNVAARAEQLETSLRDEERTIREQTGQAPVLSSLRVQYKFGSGDPLVRILDRDGNVVVESDGRVLAYADSSTND